MVNGTGACYRFMTSELSDLLQYFETKSRILVITGAGISAESGIPTYRNDKGEWQRSRPIQYQEFVREEACRQRYWTRSAVGWQAVHRARPNQAHRALASIESVGKLSLLVTQNVDRLHQQAGHKRVIDLHGRIDRVVCLDCGQYESRDGVQLRLLTDNPFLNDLSAPIAPDGDADVAPEYVSRVRSPVCLECGGVVMPDVVFYGGSVPKQRVTNIENTLQKSDGLLAIGSSLSVYSSYRFCKAAQALGIPIAIINRGTTRADDLASLKIEEGCSDVLTGIAARLI